MKESLKGIDQEQSINVKLRYDQVNKEMGILEHECSDLDTEYGQIENSIRAIRKSSEFEKASKTSDAVKRTEAAERVADLLQEAMRLYRDEMRRKVQERATETFGNLTTEKTFDRLEINDNYGLNLIIDKERVHRSAGAEQIVAMSLIEALNFNGRRVGPMILDTPVGRLDKSHRANILNYLPRVVTQLALFSHSGEIDEDSTLLIIG